MEKMKVDFSPPDITEAEINLVAEVLRSGWITTGPKTKQMERQMAEFCNVSRGVCLNSATACMELALRLFNIGPGDEVIVPAYTYSASASVVCHVGARLVLIDTAKNSFHLNYEQLESAINENTKAIIPVDIGGVLADYDRIRAIVESKKNIFKANGNMQEALGHVMILADSAHGYGARRNKKMSGELADLTAFSFHAVKNLTTSEGGGLVWRDISGIDNEEIYKQFQLYSLHGQSKDALAKTKLGAWEYDIVAPLYKCNMTDINAAMGLAQMERYDSILNRRREIIEAYDKGILSENISVLDHFKGNNQSSGHLYMVRLLGKDVDFRNNVIIEMAEAGVACNVHYKPLPMHTAYKNLGFDIKSFPNAYNMYNNEITLPLHTCLTDDQVKYVIEVFKGCAGTSA